MKRFHVYILPLLVTLSSVLVAMLVSEELSTAQHRAAKLQFESDANGLADTFVLRLRRIGQGLLILQKKLSAGVPTETNSFRSFLQGTDVVTPTGVAWAWIPNSQEKQHQRPLLPFDSKGPFELLRGLDLAKNAVLQSALANAAEKGEMSGVADVLLPETGLAQAVSFLFLPVYRSELLQERNEGSKQPVIGHLAAVVDPAELLVGSAKERSVNAIDLYLTALHSPGGKAQHILYASRVSTSADSSNENLRAATQHGVKWIQTVKFGPLSWKLLGVPERAQFSTFNGLATPLALGFGILIGLANFVGAFKGSRRSALAEAALARVQAELEQTRGNIAAVAADSERTEAERDQLRHELAELHRQKVTFFSNFSHEVRTPLNGLVGMAELLLDTTLSPEQREYVEIFQNSAESLLEIVGDVLDLSKLEAGNMTVEKGAFSLREVVGFAVQCFEAETVRKDVTMVLNVPETVPDWLIGDAPRVQQLICQLVSNAVRFAFKGGGIVVQALPANSADGKAHIHFVVSDTGIGVPYELQDKILDAFVNADSSFTRRYGATGLSLSLSSQLARMMGGKIWIKSIPYRGTAYHVELPFEEAKREASESDGAADRGAPVVDSATNTDRKRTNAGLSILIVEDNLPNQRVTARVLEKLGFAVAVATSGKDAVDITVAQDFDLILMDVQMPELDGFEATAQIREREKYSGKHVPIVALTAEAMTEDEARCLQAGMDDYLAKPISRSQLIDVIARHVKGVTVMESVEQTTGPSTPSVQ